MVALPLHSLPLGFRFHPTDEELVNHYLKGKIGGRKPPVEVISEIDVCKCEPWDLPDKSIIRTGDPEWFFFAPRDRKYPNGHRANRATEAGYWKATGKDRKIKSRPSAGSALIGMKKTLVFYRGRAPKGERTCWIIHEYRTVESEVDGVTSDQGAYVLCRLFKKSEERALNSNFDEIDENDFSPLPSGLSPGGIPLMAEHENELEKEAVQDVKKHDLQHDQKDVDGIVEELPEYFDSSAIDGLGNGNHPPKPEDSYSNSNIVSDVDGIEIDLSGINGVDILGPLEHTDVINYPQFSPPITSGCQQMGLLRNDIESDDITEFLLSSIWDNPEDNFLANSTYQDSNINAVTDGQFYPSADVTPTYHRSGNGKNMQVMKDMGNTGGTHQVQAGFDANSFVYGLPELPHSAYLLPENSGFGCQEGPPEFYFSNYSGVYSPEPLAELFGNPKMPTVRNHQDASFGDIENSSTGSGIQIRHVQQRYIPSSTSRRQGTAVRRIRLQKNICIGSPACSASDSTIKEESAQASFTEAKENNQVPKVEKSISSFSLEEAENNAQDEASTSPEKTPTSKEDTEPVSALRLRKSGSVTPPQWTAVPQREHLKSARVRRALTYLALGALVSALAVGISIYLRY